MKQVSVLFLALAAACGGGGANHTTAAAPEQEQEADGWQRFGEAIPDGDPIPAARLVADPGAYDGKTVLVEGTVDTVCKKKGCWLTLREGDQGIRVRFKDYGFFVPKDCEGRTLRLEGVFRVRMIPAEEAKHYLEDAGRHEEAGKLTGEQQEFGIVATGVRLKS